MVDARALEPFDWDGPVLSEPRGFVVRPSAAGGFEACAAALARLLTRAIEEGLWVGATRCPTSRVTTTSNPRNHTRSWTIDQLPLACRRTLLTLAVFYGFHEDDPLQVSLDSFS